VTVTGTSSSGRLGQDSQGFFFSSDTSGKVIKFATNNGTLNEWMRITSAGNVGIGTTTPGAKLEIAGGNLALPNTTSASAGVVTLGGTPFLHNFGTNNTFVGASAGNTSASLTGTDNSAFGTSALSANTTGFWNSAFGNGALVANTRGNYNSAFGWNALQSNTACCNNAFGSETLRFNTTGSLNDAFGGAALTSNTTGSSNAAVGDRALGRNTTGNSNSAFGINALAQLTSGNGNIAIGLNAGANLTGSEGNDIYIGDGGVAGESNVVRIGSGGQTFIFATGNVNPFPVTAANRFEVFATNGSCFDFSETLGTNFICFRAVSGQMIATSTGAFLSTGGVWTNASDRNLKTNFASLDGRQILARLATIPVGSWNYKSENDSIRHIGPMAQDFYAAFQVGADDKHISTIDEGGVALAAIQGLNQKLEAHVMDLHLQLRSRDAQLAAEQKENREQQSTIARQQTEIHDLAARLAKLESLAAPLP
jgi:hypothetical protein